MSRDQYKKPMSAIEWLILLMIIGIPAFVFWGAYIEAATFNKYKSPETPEATVWDAMFSELRVEAK